MDSIIKGFTELAEEAGFTVNVLDAQEGRLLSFQIYRAGDDLGDTAMRAVAEKDENGWGVNCHAVDSWEKPFYHSSGQTSGLDSEDMPAHLLKGSVEVLASIHNGIERGEIIPYADRTLAFGMQEGSLQLVVAGNEMTVSINPEFLNLTDDSERDMIEETLEGLKEIGADEMYDEFLEGGIEGVTDFISSRVRDFRPSYCVSPYPCDCGGANMSCEACFGCGVLGDDTEGPSLVVVTAKGQIKEVKVTQSTVEPADTETVAFAVNALEDFSETHGGRIEVLEDHPTEYKANLWPHGSDESEMHIQVQINMRADEEVGWFSEKRFNTHFTVQGNDGIYDESLNERATVKEISGCVSARLERAHKQIERVREGLLQQKMKEQAVAALKVNAPKTEITLSDLNRVLYKAGLDKEFAKEHDLPLKKLAYDPKTANEKITLPGAVSVGDIKKHGSAIGLQIKTISSGAKGKGLER
jgi:hypothetical protein